MSVPRLHHLMIRGALIVVCFIAAGTRPTIASADLGKQIAFDIAAQQLPSALLKFAAQSGVQVTSPGELVEGKASAGVVGTFTGREALQRILKDTTLRFEIVDENTVMIVPDVRVSSAAAGNADGSTAIARLEEVVVTAQKREERLIDVPQSVSVLSGSDLAGLGVTQFRDYASSVPGLDIATNGAGFTQVSIRGVTSGFDIGPTVGIYVDDVPFGSSTAVSASTQQALDAAPFDLDRIEVLRGPQGTLYGASSMGGLIKYVTARPDTRALFGTAQAGLSDTEEGGINYSAAGAINLPVVNDRVAVRASGFESHDGGYIDNVTLGRGDVNRSDTYGGRFDLLLTPNQALSIRINGTLQNISRQGEGTADFGFDGEPLRGKYDQDRRVQEPFDQRFRVVSGTINYDFGPFVLTSISSYQSTHTEYVFDLSRTYVPALAVFGPFSAVSAPTLSGTEKFTQEIRLASNVGGQLEWLFGAFYTHESSQNRQTFSLLDVAGQPTLNALYNDSVPSRYNEYAVFGDATWHFTQKFDITAGVRYASNDLTVEQIASGILLGPQAQTNSSDHVLTYLGDARYHVSKNTSAYVRYATGYRPGGPNYAVLDQSTGLPYQPQTFQSDTLRSYEAGIKSETEGRVFGADVSGYYIDWSNIQVATTRGFVGFIANAPGGAAIKGAEFTLSARPTEKITGSAALAYQNAYLKEANADLGAEKGERLPNVPHFTATLSVDYAVRDIDWRPSFGATFRYMPERTASFEQSAFHPQYTLPTYTALDVRAAASVAGVNVQVYVRNLLNEQGQLSALYTNIGDARVAMMQPRTVGLSLSTRF